MADRDQHPSREDEIRHAVFGQVDLQTAELEIDSSIYDGFAAAIMVKGQPRTIALTREYGDAVQLMAMIERSRSAIPAAPEAPSENAGAQIEVAGAASASPTAHDFGWALVQMRAGNKVRLPHWDISEWVVMNCDGQIVDEDDQPTRFTSQAPLLAMDWSLADV